MRAGTLSRAMRVSSRRSVRLLGLVSAALLFGAGPAAAETIHTPVDGTVAQEDQTVLFDWAWDSDQYASYLIFTQDPDPASDLWLGQKKPGKVTVTDDGYSFLSSNARVVPKQWSITPGQWYWRLCSNTVSGEDDKCYYRGAPHPITITAAPAPPPPPAPVVVTPPPVVAPAPAAPKPAPTTAFFSKADAAANARLAISEYFSYKKAPKKRKVSCSRTSSPLLHSCKVSWETARYRYSGTLTLSPEPITAADKKRNAGKIDNDDYWYTGKVVRTTKRTGRKKTVKVV